MKLKQKAIENYYEIWKKIENNKEKMLTKAILNDETRHHEILNRIHNYLIKDATLKEEDEFDLVWADIKSEC